MADYVACRMPRRFRFARIGREDVPESVRHPSSSSLHVRRQPPSCASSCADLTGTACGHQDEITGYGISVCSDEPRVLNDCVLPHGVVWTCGRASRSSNVGPSSSASCSGE